MEEKHMIIIDDLKGLLHGSIPSVLANQKQAWDLAAHSLQMWVRAKLIGL